MAREVPAAVCHRKGILETICMPAIYKNAAKSATKNMELATSMVIYWSRCHFSTSQWSPTSNIAPKNLYHKYDNHLLFMPIAAFDYSGIFFVLSNMQSFVCILNVLWPIIREWHPKRLLPLVTWFLLSVQVGVWVYIHCILNTWNKCNCNPNKLRKLPPNILFCLGHCQHTGRCCNIQEPSATISRSSNQ